MPCRADLAALPALNGLPRWRVARVYTRVPEAYRSERARFEAARGPERYQAGLERLDMSQHLATTGVLGQFGCNVVKSLG